jgi:hypothetical protein
VDRLTLVGRVPADCLDHSEWKLNRTQIEMKMKRFHILLLASTVLCTPAHANWRTNALNDIKTQGPLARPTPKKPVLPVPQSDRLTAEWKAQSSDNGDTSKGWAYSILTIHHWTTGYSFVQPTSYGVYATKAECEQARAKKIESLEKDPNDPDAPVKHPIDEWHSAAGDHGPIETLAPQDCKPY